uniref:Uncharacterized protein n=1 Tax=Anopheles culicifacies TaxID=139723 RepID=A0A182MBC8_9DIPT
MLLSRSGSNVSAHFLSVSNSTYTSRQDANVSLQRTATRNTISRRLAVRSAAVLGISLSIAATSRILSYDSWLQERFVHLTTLLVPAQILVRLLTYRFLVVRCDRAHQHRRKDDLLVVKVRIQSGNGWIGLKLFPQAEDDHNRRDEAERNEAKPHEPLEEWATLLGNVPHTVQRRVVEELLRLKYETSPKQAQRVDGRFRLTVRRHFRFAFLDRFHRLGETFAMRAAMIRNHGRLIAVLRLLHNE